MARLKIELPASFSFTTEIPIRITDINYGGHAGNDSILSIMHEARMQFLLSIGLSETGTEGAGLIMRDVMIEYRKEVFYGDILLVSLGATDLETASFALTYKLERKNQERPEVIALAKTGMVCYDYSKKKIAALTQEMRSKLLPI